MQQLPIKIRNFNPDTDFAAYIELLNVAATFDNGQQTTQEGQKQTADMLTINLGRDRFIIENPQDSEQIIAVCDCWQIAGNPSADLFLLVHPEWRRKGVASVLFKRALSHAKSLKATAIDGYATPTQTIIQNFLTRKGFTIAGNQTSMSTNKIEAFPQAQLPNSYSIQTYADLKGNQLDKLNFFLKLNNDCIRDLWGHKVIPDSDFGRAFLKNNIIDVTPDDSMFFLFDENNACIGHKSISFSKTEEGIKSGYTGIPSLHPQWRTPELSKQFALTGLNKLFDQGCREFRFSSWGESDTTIQAFESLGFETTFFEIGYQLKLI